MSINSRFAVLLGAFLLAFLVAVGLLRRAEQQRAEAAQASLRRDRAQTLERWIELQGATLRQFANDYSLWDELVQFVQRPDPEWARINLIASLETFNAAAYWVLDADGQVVHHHRRPASDQPLELPMDAATWLELTNEQPFPWFFHARESTLYELRAAPIQPSDDAARTHPPFGWLIVAREWDADFLADLGRLISAEVTVSHAPSTGREFEHDAPVHLHRALPDWRGRPVRMLHVLGGSADLEEQERTGTRAVRIFAIFGLAVLVVLAISLRVWVIQPLNRIHRALALGNPEPLGSLTRQPSEFGRLAELVVSSFEQRATLEAEIEQRRRVEQALRDSEASLRDAMAERVRLGRDLHDSVIQAIYASGLGLAAVRRLLATDPAEAERRLEQVRVTLNDTIRDLRNFITGLEPEALRRMSLSEAVHALVDLLRTAAPIQVALDINEAIAEQLSPDRRANLLQIIREAIGNVLRHSEATLVHVALLEDEGKATLVIADNGRGFEPAHAHEAGRGLTNMMERAQASGSTLRIESALGKGTRVTVSFPLIQP